MKRLERAIGVRGRRARRMSRSFRDIKIPTQAGNEVFDNVTLPRWTTPAQRTCPGYDKLSPHAKGSLTSLVFNRGPSMKGSRRREMRRVRDAVKKGNMKAASKAITDMKRLWRGKGLRGLLRRRDAEAALILR